MAGFADLHCHTRCSDGSLSAAETALLAAERGVRVLAITDHDSIEGWGQADQAAREASRVREQGLTIIPGVEINTAWSEAEIHILGYFDPRFLHGYALINRKEAEAAVWEETGRQSLALDGGMADSDEAYCSRNGEAQRVLRVAEKVAALDRTLAVLRHKRVERAQAIVDKLKGLGIDIVWGHVEKLVTGPSVGRSHIARVLVERGVAATVQEAFARYLNAGAAAYVPNYRIEPLEAVKLIRDSGGAAVLAHPKDMNRAVIREWVEAGLAGLEVWHPDHSAVQTEALQRLTEYYGILAMGGSDFHGFGLHAELGSFGVDEETVNRLRQKLAKSYERV